MPDFFYAAGQWLSQRPPVLAAVVAAITVIGSGLLGWIYYAFQVRAGGLMASGSFDIVTERFPVSNKYPVKVSECIADDIIAVSITIKRNDKWAVRLFYGVIKLVRLAPDDKFDDTKKKYDVITLNPFVTRADMFTNNHGVRLNTEELNFPSDADSVQIFKRRVGIINGGLEDGRISLGPGDEIHFGGYLIVPAGTTCVIDVSIGYEQWAMPGKRKGGAFYGSTVVSPIYLPGSISAT